MKNYDERSCVRDLMHKKSIKISNDLIKVDKDNQDVGIKSWGKIDYLCNYCGYRYIVVEFSESKERNDYDDNTHRHKPQAKERFSLARSVKRAMK